MVKSSAVHSRKGNARTLSMVPVRDARMAYTNALSSLTKMALGYVA